MADEEKLRRYLKRATADLRQAQRRLQEAEDRDHEPIAIIGMACRYPGGVTTPEDLWRLVADEVDAISGFPTDRNWDLANLYHPDPDHPGTTYTREGGFLYDAGRFDAAFFGISPREALAMDPQHRLLMETAWETFESAGLGVDALHGSDTGVFTGVTTQDYVTLMGDTNSEVEGYVGTGTAPSIASGRVSYTFGLEGPAVTIDTACSSSLVAMHLACLALRHGGCGLALAGGASVLTTSAMFTEFSRQRALSPSGRCKSFAAAADGTGWGEGAGWVLLERLSDARRNGHRVLAVIRGSAVNQDGASNGLTAPNGPSQQRVIRQALADAWLSPADVDVVEAHGTGTTLGDPIEADALIATYGRNRPAERPLWLGSIKSNIGHTHAAAGVAGVIKMVLAMRYGRLPATLHVDEPTPHVNWDAGAVKLLTEALDWPEADRPRRAGVSSFGISGTNAHVILEQSPEPDAAEPVEVPGALPWVISAKSAAALRGQAQRLADRVTEDTSATDVAWSLLRTRSAFPHRAVVVGAGREELLAGLAELAAGRPHPNVVEGVAGAGGSLVWMFSGQGSQRPGMGKGLYDRFPAFAEAFDEVCALLDPHLEHPLKAVVFDGQPDVLEHTTYAQAGLFALQVALARLLDDFGVRPEAVVGHSVGEITAAHVAGVFDLPDACRLLAARATLMGSLPIGGAMCTIAATAEEIAETLDPQVSIAALNSPASTVISGPAELVAQAGEAWAGRGRKTRMLKVSHAFHSGLMDPIIEPFTEAISELTYNTPKIPLISNLTGEPADETITTPDYWARHIRQPVRFHPAITHLVGTGPRTFLEIGPAPVLATAAQHTLDETGQPDSVIAAVLHHQHDDIRALTQALAKLHTTGIAVKWSEMFPADPAPQVVDLPTYAFQREWYWLEPPAPTWQQWQRQQAAIDSWRYEITWANIPQPDTAPVLSGTWLIVTPDADHPATRLVTEALRDHGADPEVTTLDHVGATAEIAGVISLLALDETPHPDHPAVPTGLAATTTLVQRLGETGIEAPLWCITQGAVATNPTEPLSHPLQAQAWGLGRVAALEHPTRWGGLIDLPESTTPSTGRQLAAILGTDQTDHRFEDQVAIRSNALARRLRRAFAPTSTSAWQPSGSVLITGGTGGLGAQLARRLADNGAPHLILTGPEGSVEELRAELTASGARVTVTDCDLTDRATLARLLADVPGDQPLTAVIHAAGIPDRPEAEHRPVAELDPERLNGAVAAKAYAASLLDELTRDLDLSAFVLFSSAAATWGSGQQAAYAAANTYLDALAEHRRAAGLPATSIAWGPWNDPADVGDPAHAEYLARRGLNPLDPALAAAAFGDALANGDTTLTIADIDWDRFPQTFAAQRPSPLLADLAPADRPGQAADASPLQGELAGHSPAEQRHLLTRHVQTLAAAILGHSSPEAVPPTQPFKELGFDSLTAVELRNQLTALIGLPLPTTLVFDYPNAAALADYLREQLTGERTTALPALAGAATDEPIAIIGMACRYPGDVTTPDELWQLVTDQVDAISDFPTDRGWDLKTLFDPDPDHHGTSYVHEGGFLHNAAEFDPAFFGISPREALAIDPQQRLLLETAWETLEHAGINPATLHGSNTGVFAGGTFQGYGSFDGPLPDEVQGQLLAGTTPSVLSGRVSYTFGFEGPAVTVDTACSSSLVAIHLAAQALRTGECGLALAGGVNVMATPGSFTEFSRQRGLARDGRCKPFSAAADGTAWSEGAGLLLLERLSDARHNGHHILAVIKGSAINQDGASNGLTAPNGPSQQRVIRQALANAHLSPAEVDVVEAHGTGTSLGDPIEAQALIATYGQDRDRPLWLGSVKSNIGHTQHAAGVAGVIKMVMAMRHGRLPASLHIDEPTPHVDWNSGAVQLLTGPADWPNGERPRRAGVSAFGASGTNAHLIVEQAEPQPTEPRTVEQDGPFAWVVSARSAAALRGQAGRLATWLREQSAEETSPADVAWSLVTTRATFEHRAVLIGTNQTDLLTGLAELADGNPHPNLVQGTAGPVGPGPVLVFPGQGSQWTGMGAALLETSPVFAARIAECEQALAPHVDWSLTEVLRGGGGLERVDVVQPALWAVMISLAAVWAEHGVTPSAVIGHSQGEIAAACIAGALTLEDAARVVALRSRALRRLSGKGAMASLAMSTEEATPLLGQDVVIAAINGPASTVISGPPDQIQAIVDANERARRIDVDYASHGPQVDEITDELRNLLTGINPAATDVAFYSTLTGARIDTTILNTDYWITNLRQPVRFADAINALLGDGYRTFIESSPHPVLTPGIQDTIDQAALTATTIPTLRRDQGDHHQLLHALAHAHTTGIPIDWTTTLPTANTLDLPTYAFQYERYWLVPPTSVPGAGDPVDAEVWGAIEELDVEAMSGALQLDGDEAEVLRPALPILSAWRRQRRRQVTVDSWRYEIAWANVPQPATAPVLDGTWLVVVPAAYADDEVTRTVVEALREHGAEPRMYPVEPPGLSAITLTTELAGADLAGVISLLALDEDPHPDHPAVPAGLAATTALIQGLGTAGIEAPLWCVTQGAVATNPAETLPRPLQAQVWGLGRVAALEYPGRWGGLIDLPAADAPRIGERLVTVLSRGQGDDHFEDQVAIRATATLARRLEHAAAPAITAGRWEPTGSTLITGGTGGIGAQLARWLARNGAPHLILTSRRGPDAPGMDELRAELTELGARVTVTACDVADRDALAELLACVPAEQPLRAVIHAAGITDSEPLTDVDPERLNRLIAPKAHAAALLHELTRDLDLSAFVMFSSGAAIWGSAQQAAYGAANTYLDALAEHRRALGLPATSVAWGPWGETGMAADDFVIDYLAQRGLRQLAPDLAITALHDAISNGDTTLTVADLDWERFPITFTAQRPSPLLDRLSAIKPAEDPAAGAVDAAPLRAELAGASPAEQQQILVGHVRSHAAAILGHATPDAVPPGQPFNELGFDSLTAVELRNRLAGLTGLSLPTTLVFDYPTSDDLARYLRGQLVEDEEATEERVLDGLDRWETSSAAAVLDESARRRVARRLQILLAKWSDTDGEAERSATHRELETATADDIFDLISNEFGKS